MSALVRRPAVAVPGRPVSGLLAAAGLLLVGGATFLGLAHGRASRAEAEGLPRLDQVTVAEPLPLSALGAPALGGGAEATAAPVATPALTPALQPAPMPQRAAPVAPVAALPLPPPPLARTGPGEEERLRAPALVVDLAPVAGSVAVPAPAAPVPGPSGGGAVPLAAERAGASVTAVPLPVADGARPMVLAQAVVPPAGAAQPAQRINPAIPQLSTTESFAARVADAEVQVAKAERMSGLSTTVVQGTIIAGALETAINSDLPGYVRAVVSRDVLSFDGTQVLVPAGSRLVGQYSAGVAQGASRVFILWTRLIRPDGVSVSLASPAIDDLGQGGLGGQVNRHFLQRYGGGILLSVLSGGISAAASAAAGGGTVIVGSLGQVQTLAQQAAKDLDIPPTIKTPQGASVRIFVARDLDFSAVGPAQ